MSKYVLYIGSLANGSTSKMRCEAIKKILKNEYDYVSIDTDIPFFASNRIARSLGFRFKIGQVINRTNQYIISLITEPKYQLIWIDKAVFISEKTTTFLRARTKYLVHFTPDTAFYCNRSKHFEKSIYLYDLLVTTKSFDLFFYEKLVTKNKIHIVTQGYSEKIHKKYIPFHEKIDGVVFIGRYEKNRGLILDYLIQNNIHVAVAGIKWKKFALKHLTQPNFKYLGESIHDKEYAQIINKYTFSIGFLSKLFPELHTTRTLEIPACGTALITEKNAETNLLFNDSEAIFFKNKEELVQKILIYTKDREALSQLIENGYKRVVSGNFTHQLIIENIINRFSLL